MTKKDVNLPFDDLNRFKFSSPENTIDYEIAGEKIGSDVLYHLQPGIILRVLNLNSYTLNSIPESITDLGEVSYPGKQLVIAFKLKGNNTLKTNDNTEFQMSEGTLTFAYSDVDLKLTETEDPEKDYLIVMLMLKPEVLLKAPFSFQIEQLPFCLHKVYLDKDLFVKTIMMNDSIVQATNTLLSADSSDCFSRSCIPRFMRLGHACIEQAKSPWLGLEMGTVTSPCNLGLAGLIALSAPSLKQALQQLIWYEPLSSYNTRGQSSFYYQGELAIAQFYSISPYNEYNYFVVDSVLSGWYQLCHRLTGQRQGVIRVCFEFPAPAYQHKYDQYFACEVLFEQDFNGLVFKAEALNWPCLDHCQTTFYLLKRQANSELDKLRLGQSFSERVSKAISPLLSDGTPTLEQVAEQLNTPPWTVRRKLMADGTSFQQTLNKTRRELAVSYICDTQLSLGEIAYLLGFASPAAFQHAFKRWLDIAPGQYRVLHQQKN